MSVLAATGAQVGGVGRRMAPQVRETFWGYEIRENAAQDEHETALESVLRFVGLVLVLAAYAQWLLPASLFGADPGVTRALLTFILGASGAGLYWFANRGLRNALQVDLSRRELRFVSLNARDQSRMRRKMPMDGVQSAFLRRSKDPGHLAELCLRLATGGEILIAHGAEHEMMNLHRRLCVDLRPLKARLDDKIAERPLFISSRYAED